ncbi:carboxylesterase YbfK [Paenibacillus sp. J31TS4]|uniref:alpha/beta fold hydrolase n=1 Tax=Paenibacillus sp. J31TS4 TaxID=2807195 RepID=UPI001B1A410B|nr:alpha/beta hydrolase [Paenibacillus sp. J31TS4]GIP40186.1 carboxylesterase YbfK [Paenibacillus sp. J31TS4]
MAETISILRKNGKEEDFLRAYDTTLKLWPVPYEERMVATRFGETHLVTAGQEDAPPLVLLHGMTFSATMWYPNIEAFASRYRVYALDTLGDMGKGRMTRLIKSRQDAAEWLVDVMDGLGLSSAVVAGHSMGGWLAMNAALHAPDRVRRMVLFAPAAGIGRITPKFLFKVYPAVLFPNEKRIQREVEWFLSPSYQPDERADTVIRQFKVSGINCIPQMRLAPSVFKDDVLQRLTMKTLLLVGDQEVIYNPHRMLERASRLMPDVRTGLIPRAGHGLTIEQAELVNEAVLDFLQA